MKKTALMVPLLLMLLLSTFSALPVQAENWSTPTPILYLEKTVNPNSAFRDNTITGLTISADGTKIAFSARIDGHNEIFVANWDGTELKQLTKDSRHNVYPSLSGNGSKITFYSCNVEEFVNDKGYVYAESHSDWRVFVVNSDGTELKQITNTGGSRYSSITYDGSKIAFLEGTEVCVINPDGNELSKLTAPMVSAEAASISGVGSKIVFIGEKVLNNLELFVVNSDGTDLTQITDGAGQGNGCAPSISGDGKTIVFRSAYDNKRVLISFYNNQTGLWSTPTAIVSMEYLIQWPCITADGKKIFFGTMDIYDQDSDKVFTVNSDGTGLAEIYSGPQQSSASLTTNADGSKIAFVDFANNGIFVSVDLDTGLNAPTPATPPATTPASPNPTPSPIPTPFTSPSPTSTATLAPTPSPMVPSSPVPSPTIEITLTPKPQEDAESFSPTIATFALVFIIATVSAVLLIYFKKRKH